MKKGIFLFSLLALGALWYLNQKDQSWQTFKKTTTQKIQSYKTTKKEKKEARIVDTPTKTRVPASKAPLSEAKKIEKSTTKRKTFLHPNQEFVKDADPINSPHKNWKKRMGNDLLRFLRPETKLFVKELESLTLSKDGRPHHVEKVLIKLSSPEGRLYSYNALVDSETGKLIRTWNRTIHEDLFLKDKKRLRATGAMTQEGTIRY